MHRLCGALRRKFPRESGWSKGCGLRGGCGGDCCEVEEGMLGVWPEEEGEGLGAESEGEQEEGEEVSTCLESRQPLLVLPLYSLLSPAQQAKV